MNKQFCSLLNAQAGEPIEGSAPEKQKILLFPAEKRKWHSLNKKTITPWLVCADANYGNKRH